MGGLALADTFDLWGVQAVNPVCLVHRDKSIPLYQPNSQDFRGRIQQ